MAGTISVGDKLPDITLRTLTADGPQEVQTAEFFAGKKAILFAVVGAYTGTCNNQLPTYVENADAIKAKGVDVIACLSVNDPFALDAWGKSFGAGDKVTMLADGNAEFSEAIGMAFDGSGFGLGTRSLRYAMIVEDGTVTSLKVEETPGVCEVSDGSSLLASL